MYKTPELTNYSSEELVDLTGPAETSYIQDISTITSPGAPRISCEESPAFFIDQSFGVCVDITQCPEWDSVTVQSTSGLDGKILSGTFTRGSEELIDNGDGFVCIGPFMVGEEGFLTVDMFVTADGQPSNILTCNIRIESD